MASGGGEEGAQSSPPYNNGETNSSSKPTAAIITKRSNGEDQAFINPALLSSSSAASSSSVVPSTLSVSSNNNNNNNSGMLTINPENIMPHASSQFDQRSSDSHIHNASMLIKGNSDPDSNTNFGETTTIPLRWDEAAALGQHELSSMQSMGVNIESNYDMNDDWIYGRTSLSMSDSSREYHPQGSMSLSRRQSGTSSLQYPSPRSSSDLPNYHSGGSLNHHRSISSVTTFPNSDIQASPNMSGSHKRTLSGSAFSAPPIPVNIQGSVHPEMQFFVSSQVDTTHSSKLTHQPAQYMNISTESLPPAHATNFYASPPDSPPSTTKGNNRPHHNVLNLPSQLQLPLHQGGKGPMSAPVVDASRLKFTNSPSTTSPMSGSFTNASLLPANHVAALASLSLAPTTQSEFQFQPQAPVGPSQTIDPNMQPQMLIAANEAMVMLPQLVPVAGNRLPEVVLAQQQQQQAIQLNLQLLQQQQQLQLQLLQQHHQQQIQYFQHKAQSAPTVSNAAVGNNQRQTNTNSNSNQNSRRQEKEGGNPSNNNKKTSLYKTELCRSWEETGHCKYGSKCQFAHSQSELRIVDRHPKYKTQMCKTFWEQGACPYGKRCCFIHTMRPEDTPVHALPPNSVLSQPQQRRTSSPATHQPSLQVTSPKPVKRPSQGSAFASPTMTSVSNLNVMNQTTATSPLPPSVMASLATSAPSASSVPRARLQALDVHAMGTRRTSTDPFLSLSPGSITPASTAVSGVSGFGSLDDFPEVYHQHSGAFGIDSMSTGSSPQRTSFEVAVNTSMQSGSSQQLLHSLAEEEEISGIATVLVSPTQQRSPLHRNVSVSSVTGKPMTMAARRLGSFQSDVIHRSHSSSSIASLQRGVGRISLDSGRGSLEDQIHELGHHRPLERTSLDDNLEKSFWPSWNSFASSSSRRQRSVTQPVPITSATFFGEEAHQSTVGHAVDSDILDFPDGYSHQSDWN